MSEDMMFEVPLSVLEKLNSLVGEKEQLIHERDAAQTKVADYEETYRRVIAEECGKDEKHCTCVPALRLGLQRADQQKIQLEHRAVTAEQAHECANTLLVQAEKERDELRATLEAVEHEVAQVYWTITNGKFAKANTEAVYILEEYQRVLEAEVEPFRDTLVDNEAYGVQLIHERDAARARVKELEKAGRSAVHALMSYQYGNGSPDLAEAVAKHVQAVLVKNPTVCVWKKEDDPEWNTWSSACGQMWVFESEGPKDNDMHYCPFCGMELCIGANEKAGGE